MKGGPQRKILEIKDFSGGQVTRSSLKGLDPKYSVDALNVYSEGAVLRRRDGFTVMNPTSASGVGNGIYNWTRNVTDQNLMVYFGTTLSKIDITSGAWDGVLDTVGTDSASGTAFTNAIMHFVTYNGTLIMTTENRDKPQYMRVNDSSHYDIETGGAGVGPFAKYCQVWKNHAWFLNLGGGSELNEECNSLTSWTDNDVGTGASTQTVFDGKSTFRLNGGTSNGDNAKITKDIGLFSDNYSFEIKTYFDTLNTIANGDYAEFNIYNGVISLQARFSDDGLAVYDGASWNTIGVGVVSEDSWATWKFLVTGGTATSARVDIYKNGVPVGLQADCTNASTANDGQIDLFARAAGTSTRADYYIDYMYVNSVSATTNYLQNNQFENWGPLNGSCATLSTASSSYLSLPDHAAFNFADGDFTIECMLNLAATSTAPVGIFTQGTATSDQTYFHIRNGALVFSSVTGGSTIAYHSTASLTWNTAEWYNLSLVRYGSALYMFRRGQSLEVSATTSLGATSLPNFSSTIYVGAIAGTAASFAGSIDEIRVSTSARYTAGYNVSTANFTSDSNTSLLLHLDSNFTDSSSYTHTITTANGIANTTGPLAALCWSASTSLVMAREGTTIKEGTYSMKLTGTGSFSQTLSMPSGISGGSTYVAGWVKPPSSGNYQFSITDGVGTYNSSVFVGSSTAWEYRFFQFTSVSSATNININLNILTNDTFYADSLSLIPAGTVAYSSDYSDRIQRTAVGTYNDFTGADSGYNDLITSGDVGLTGSFILNDRMYVMKAWSIHRFTYTQSYPLIDIKQVKKTVGTKSPRSIKNVDTPEGEVVIFLGSDRRLYLFDGLTAIAISDDMSTNNGLSSVYFRNINTDALDTVFAVVHADLGHYELFVPMGSSTTPDYSIVYDYVLKSLWPFSNRGFSAGDVSDDGAGLRRIYALTSTSGKVCLLNQGSSDNGSAINAYWTSTKLGNALNLTRSDEIEVETPVGTYAPTFSWRGDWETNYTTKSVASGTNSHVYAPGRIDNLIQFKVADNTTTDSFKIWSITMTERPVGVGK